MHWIDITMLGYFTNEKTVGLYHPATRTAGLLRVALVALMGIFSPMLSQFFAQKKQQEMHMLYKLVVRWIMTLSLPFTVLLVLFPRKIMLLFGGQYMPAASVLVVLTFATMIQSFVGPGPHALNMTGHPKVNLTNFSIVVVINVVLNILWIPKYGIMGAAWATFTSLIVLGILHSVKVWQLIKLHPFSLKLMKPFVAGLVTYVILFMIKPYLMPFHTIVTLSLACTITFLSFAVVLWLLKFDADDREVWKALIMIAKSSIRL